jgi:hypothetical protein
MSDDDSAQKELVEEVQSMMNESILESIAHGAEAAGEWGAKEVVGVAETTYHAGSGVVDMVEGDWDGAQKQMTEMSSSALNVATGGALGLTETTYDAGTVMTGGGPGAHDVESGALKRAGEAIGDAVYDATHGPGVVEELQEMQRAQEASLQPPSIDIPTEEAIGSTTEVAREEMPPG